MARAIASTTPRTTRYQTDAMIEWLATNRSSRDGRVGDAEGDGDADPDGPRAQRVEGLALLYRLNTPAAVSAGWP